MSAENMLKKYSSMMNDYIDFSFSKITDTPDVLKSSMLYTLKAGGKRIRPAIMLEIYRILGGEPESILNFALAVEMVHTYSLIHDDLPCMDNDTVRRSQPSNHVKFGEDIALLAGDALLTQAFLSAADANDNIMPNRTQKAVKLLANAAGMCNMVGGQVMDLQSEGKSVTIDTLEDLQKKKTVALLRVNAEIACALADADDEKTALLCAYCDNIGRAFQIKDDILDVTGDEEIFGKPVGSDVDSNKSTYISLLGLKRSQELVEQLTNKAQECLKSFENAQDLSELAIYLCNRNK